MSFLEVRGRHILGIAEDGQVDFFDGDHNTTSILVISLFLKSNDAYIYHFSVFWSHVPFVIRRCPRLSVHIGIESAAFKPNMDGKPSGPG